MENDFQSTVDRLCVLPGKDECLRTAYDILAKKYYGHRLSTITRFYRAWPSSVETLWKKSGFLHCTNLNRLLKALLVRSGHFEADDVRFRWTLFWNISPHQYAQVKIDDRWIDVDLWAKAYGIPFGDHARGFHTSA